MLLEGELLKPSAEVRTTCCVPQCGGKIKPLFKFPNPKRYRDRFWEWVRVVSNPKHANIPVKQIWNNCVCYKHFVDEDFETVGGNKLRKHAVPSLNLPPSSQESFLWIIDHPENLADLPITDGADRQTINFEELLENIKPMKCILQGIFEESVEILDSHYEISSVFDLYEYVEPLNIDDSQDTETEENTLIIKNTSNTETLLLCDDNSIQVSDENEKPHFAALKTFSLDSCTNYEICRLCFCSFHQEDVIQMHGENINSVKEMLRLVLPEVDLDLYKNPVICVNCEKMLTTSCDLRQVSLATEETIKEVIEKNEETKNPNLDLIIVTKSLAGERVVEYCSEETSSDFDHNYGLSPSLLDIKRKLWENQELQSEKVQLVYNGLNITADKPQVKQSKKRVPESFVCEECGYFTKRHESFKRHCSQHQDNKWQEDTSLEFEQNYEQDENVYNNIIITDTNLELKQNYGQNENVYNNIIITDVKMKKMKPKKRASESFVCDKCGYFTKRHNSFKRHLNTHEKNKLLRKRIQPRIQPKLWKCDHCPATYAQRDRLILHSREHQTAHTCHICDKTFKFKSSLRNHIRYVHLKEYRQCHLCGKEISAPALRLHLLMHNPTKIYNCNFCPKKFIRLRAIKDHIRSRHTEFTPLSCQYCGRTIKYAGSLEKHIQLFHLNQGENICDVCNKPFWKKESLLKHKIRLHGRYTQEKREG